MHSLKPGSSKIARYTLDNWNNLDQYTHMDHLRAQLKLLNRQFHFYIKEKTASKNNLISLLDETFPGCNKFFDSPTRDDEHQKWVDGSAILRL